MPRVDFLPRKLYSHCRVHIHCYAVAVVSDPQDVELNRRRLRPRHHQHEEDFKAQLEDLEQRQSLLDLEAYASLMRACGDAGNLSEAKRLHEAIVRSGCEPGRYLRNLLVEMYGKCGDLHSAYQLFYSILQQNTYSWNILMSVLLHNGMSREAIGIIRQMDFEGFEPTSVTYTTALSACAECGALAEGIKLHDRITKSGWKIDVILGTSLITMYGKCRELNKAKLVFNEMPTKTVVTWNAMIAACTHNGEFENALFLYKRMRLKNDITFIGALEACTSLLLLEEGKSIHKDAIECGYSSHTLVGNALLNMYGKCSSIDDAKDIFEKITVKSIVSWTSLLAAYAQNGYVNEAMELYWRMDVEGIKPNEVTFVSILDACASLSGLPRGKAVHKRILATGFQLNLCVNNSLLNMYARCGGLKEAKNIFTNMSYKDSFSWSTMVAAYAQHGYYEKALQIYQERDLEGINPEGIAFISVFALCSHGGLLDRAHERFVWMQEDYGIVPMLQHYHCLIDLLGRMGRLKDAEELLDSMPYWPDELAWTSLLGSSKTHGSLCQGSNAEKVLSEMNPNISSSKVLLSQISVM